jgi:hypothetical protein
MDDLNNDGVQRSKNIDVVIMGLAPNAPSAPQVFPERSQNVPSAGDVVLGRACVAAVVASSHAGILRADDTSYVLPDGMIYLVLICSSV